MSLLAIVDCFFQYFFICILAILSLLQRMFLRINYLLLYILSPMFILTRFKGSYTTIFLRTLSVGMWTFVASIIAQIMDILVTTGSFSAVASGTMFYNITLLAGLSCCVFFIPSISKMIVMQGPGPNASAALLTVLTLGMRALPGIKDLGTSLFHGGTSMGKSTYNTISQMNNHSTPLPFNYGTAGNYATTQPEFVQTTPGADWIATPDGGSAAPHKYLPPGDSYKPFQNGLDSYTKEQ